jgi:transposase
MHPLYGKIAGIDVHKKVLYVVIASQGAPGGDLRARFGATREDLAGLSAWLTQEQVDTVVMESTANYWKPVWLALESHFHLLLAQARSNAAPQGRKTDYADALRLVKRLLSDDLRLSYVPEPEQRDWRSITRTRVEYGRNIVRLRNWLEGILEEGQIKISGLLSDLLGVSGRRMLRALAEGQTDARQLAALGVGRLRASEQELAQALDGQLRPIHRHLLRQHLDHIEWLERQIGQLDAALSQMLKEHQDSISRLCQVPGIAVNAAEQIIAELGPRAETFPTPGQLASWVGVCPGREQSAGVSKTDASPKGNLSMRCVLTQCAWAAARTKGSYFEALFHRLIPKIGVHKAIWAVAHRLLRIVWRILHLGEQYLERGLILQHAASLQRRFRRLAKHMALLGYTIQVTPPPHANPQPPS